MPGPVSACVTLETAFQYVSNTFDGLSLVPVIFKIRLDKNGIIVKTKPDITNSYFIRHTCIVLDKTLGSANKDEEVMFDSP